MGEQSANHLDGQVSPYLAAHAHDPVDWHPWGPDAFALAAETDRPVFLSIGYQSCHWCHVMQRESFRDEATAQVLNRDFVPVKVDREVRPDVDALYMAYVQASTGSGGWPLSVFLTPELLPFLGGTYFPPVSPTPRMPSFGDVLGTAADAWRHQREHTIEVARDALEFLRQQQAPHGSAWSRGFVDAAAERVLSMRDETHGGFGRAPKFPMSAVVTFLLARHESVHDERALEASIQAILAIIRGGVWDQVEGGLFRYATDDEWLVPHFEKMLYDQAGLLGNLASLVDSTQADEFRLAASATASFLERRLAREGSGYHSSLDAETAGVEGATYVWRYEELAQALSADELTIAETHLGVARRGNWEDGLNVLTRRRGRDGDAAAVDAVLQHLREVRDHRPQPAVVTNALVGWNALVAQGLLETGAAMEDGRLVEQGLRTLDWLLAEALDGDAVVHAVGDPGATGVRLLEDHSALVAACVTATQVGGRDLLETAETIHYGAVERFGRNGGAGGFAMSDATELPLAAVEQADSPTPSGAALLADNELRLSSLLDRDPATALLDAVERQMSDVARIAPHMAGHALATATRRMHILEPT